MISARKQRRAQIIGSDPLYRTWMIEARRQRDAYARLLREIRAGGYGCSTRQLVDAITETLGDGA